MNPEDIRLLLAGETPELPDGAYYTHGITEFAGGGADSEIARMVFFHELAHADLNRASQYGLILQSVGWYVQNFPHPSDEARLGALIYWRVTSQRHLTPGKRAKVEAQVDTDNDARAC